MQCCTRSDAISSGVLVTWVLWGRIGVKLIDIWLTNYQTMCFGCNAGFYVVLYGQHLMWHFGFVIWCLLCAGVMTLLPRCDCEPPLLVTKATTTISASWYLVHLWKLCVSCFQFYVISRPHVHHPLRASYRILEGNLPLYHPILSYYGFPIATPMDHVRCACRARLLHRFLPAFAALGLVWCASFPFPSILFPFC